MKRKLLYFLLFFSLSLTSLWGKLLFYGKAYLKDEPIKNYCVVQLKYWDNSQNKFIDFTDYNEYHFTYGGYWKAYPLLDDDTTPEKEGFSDGDTVYVFIDYEKATISSTSSTPSFFSFSQNTDEKVAAHITSIAPSKVSNFTANSLPNGQIKLEFTPSNGAIYNIYYDNTTGSINYDSPLLRLSGDQNSVIISLPNGNYKFGIRAQNKEGKEELNTDVTASALCDDIPPQITITSPTEKEIISGNLDIIGSIKDNSNNLKKYNLYLGKGYNPKEFINIGSGSVDKTDETIVSFDTTTIDDGIYTLQIKAIDYTSNKAFKKIHLIINNSSHLISSPINYESIFGNVEIKGSATDAYFQKYILKIGEGENPTNWIIIKESNTQINNETLGNFDSANYSGLYKIKLEIYNINSVISKEETITVFINNTPPQLVLTSPSEKIVYGRYPKIYIEGISQPQNTLKVTSSNLGINQEELEISALDGKFFLTPPSLQEGANYFSFEAIGLNSLKTTINLIYYYDTMPPQLISLTPNNNYNSSDNILEIKGQSEPGISVKINSLSVKVDPLGYFSKKVFLKEGENNFLIELQDKAGNLTTIQRTYYFNVPPIDSRPPEIIDYQEIENHYYNTSSPLLSFYLNDEKSGIALNSLTLKIDGTIKTNYTIINVNEPYSYKIELTPNLEDGKHTLEINCQDKYHNQLQTSLTFYTDTQKPFLKYYIIPQDTNSFDFKIEISDQFPSYPQFITANIYFLEQDESWDEDKPTQIITMTLQDTGSIKYYQTHFDNTLPFSGILVLKANYQDLSGNKSTNIGIYGKREISNQELTFQLPDSSYIYFPSFSLSSWENLLFYSLDLTDSVTQTQRNNSISGKGLTPISIPYEIKIEGTETFTFEKSITIALHYYDEDNNGKEDFSKTDESKLGVFYFNPYQKQYEFIPSFQNTQDNLLIFQTNHLSEYRILADSSPPTIIETSPQSPNFTYISQPRFAFKIYDLGSGINSNKIEVKIDNKINNYIYKAEKNLLIIKPDSQLSPNFQHRLTIKVFDNLNNYTFKEKTFQATENKSITQVIAYPSPAKSYVKFRYFLGTNAQRVVIKIYNETGKTIKIIEGDIFSDFNEVEWDLTDKKLNPVPNGTYFYRIYVNFGDFSQKKEGKLMVLR